MYTCMPPHMSLDHTNHFINILQPFFPRPHWKRDRGRYGRATDFLPMFETRNLQPNLFSKDDYGKTEGRKVTESIVARSCNLDGPNTGMKKWQLTVTQKSWHQVGPACFDGEAPIIQPRNSLHSLCTARSEILESLAWLCPCHLYTFTQDFIPSPQRVRDGRFPELCILSSPNK